MVGRSVVLSVEREEHKAKSDPIFHAENLQVLDDRNLPAVKGLSLGVRPGEIVGIAGIDGNGQSQLADAIMGLRHVESGVIRYNAEDITHISTWKRINKGIGYVPADRQRFGLVLPFTVAENIAMGYHDRKPNSSCTILDYAAINTKAADLVQQFDIRTPSELAPAGNLSGGNQQKVILAREFSRNPQFLLINQPTRGLDVGAIEYIHTQILNMRKEDVGILLISLELEEIFSLSDRILVLYDGVITKEFVPEQTDEMEIGCYMAGGTEYIPNRNTHKGRVS